MKKFLFSMGIIVLFLLCVYLVRNSINIANDNEENIVDVSDSIKEYSYTNETLSPVEVEFKVEIDVKQNSDGQYYIYNATYQPPIAINFKGDSFQIDFTSAKLIDSNKTYVVTATGTFAKDGNYLGTKNVSAYYYLDTGTGKITMSYM